MDSVYLFVLIVISAFFTKEAITSYRQDGTYICLEKRQDKKMSDKTIGVILVCFAVIRLSDTIAFWVVTGLLGYCMVIIGIINSLAYYRTKKKKIIKDTWHVIILWSVLLLLIVGIWVLKG